MPIPVPLALLSIFLLAYIAGATPGGYIGWNYFRWITKNARP